MTPPTALPAAPDALRDPWLDNARFALIGLVLLGHAMEPLLGHSPLLASIYRFVYLFHMPAFAFVSGAVAHPRLDPPRLKAIAFRLLLPYAAFQGIYALAAQTPGWPDAGPGGIATPYWLLWYLLSLAAWRLLLPLFAHLRHPMRLAIGLALLAGLADDVGYYLSLSRTLVLFPMFLLGWRRANAWRAQGGTPRARLLAVLTLAALLALATSTHFDTQWLYGSLGYGALDTAPLTGVAWRALQLLAGVAGSFAVLSLVPRRAGPFTDRGRHSLPAYLLHGLALKLAVAAGAYALIIDRLPRPYWLPTTLVVAALLLFLLCRPGATRLLAPITAPRWLERRLWRGGRASQGQPG